MALLNSIFIDINYFNKQFLNNLHKIETDQSSHFQRYIGIANPTDTKKNFDKNRYEDGWTHNFVYNFVW